MNDPAIFDLNWDTIQETCEASPLTDWEPALRRLRAQHEKDQGDLAALRFGEREWRGRAMGLTKELDDVRAYEDIRAAIEVLRYVSRGRRFVDVEPYPDAKARIILGGITAEPNEP